jgi:hypothetical protein
MNKPSWYPQRPGASVGSACGGWEATTARDPGRQSGLARRPGVSAIEAKNMKSALDRIAVACLLLEFNVAVAIADGPPKLDVNMTCAAAAQYSISAGRDKEACLGDETTAQTTLAENWSKYNVDDKDQCVGTVKTGGPPSYVELLSCIEILRDAKQIREGEPIVREQSAASAPQSMRRRRR